MSQYWSWALTAVGAFGLYLAGRKNKAGWTIGLSAQFLWISYAIATRQWGFIASAIIYGSVYAKNFLRWRADDKQASGHECPERCPAVPCPDCPDCFSGTRAHTHAPPVNEATA